MSQIFHPSMNTLAKASIVGAVLLAGGLGWVATSIDRSPYMTNQGMIRAQPIAFSHEHHVRGLGLDCRYCHTSVTDSEFAGLPPTKTCMTCHSKIWTDAKLLQPVRESWDSKIPLQWSRVHNLPDFVYFRHDIHVNKGVACVTCHGQVNQMPLMFQNASLQMEWCLNCHREPEKYLWPRENVFDTDYAPKDQASSGKALVEEYHIPTDGRLTNCYTCHR
jgi:hypothetical protein